MNPRPFNVQWFVPCTRKHVVLLTSDGGLYVGPENERTTGERVAHLYGGNGLQGAAGRIFQVIGNDVMDAPVVVPLNPER